jgi:dynein heavy chain
MRKNCVEPVSTVNNNIAQSLMRILDCYFADYYDTEIKKVSPEEIDEMELCIESYFIFAFIWSIGCTTNLEGRERFSGKVRELMGKDVKYKMPAEGLVYDYCFIKDKKEWVIWTNTVAAYSVDTKLSYGEIVVPTFDSIRMKYLKRILVMNKKHVLSPGPTGTGKTVNINQLLTSELNEDYQTIPLTFSAQTSANQTQDALDEKFDKRRKGVYGPPPGKRFVIFVDDLNMPKKEEYGAQPPIELLRQWMDHQGWYDRKSKEKPFMKIEDIIFIGAMGPPGGGRSALTRRLERHFNIITYTNLGKESITMIFQKIVYAFLSSFSEAIAKCLDEIVEATQRVYNAVATNLKPTPSKSHYTFNLRDMSKIFQGLCSA